MFRIRRIYDEVLPIDKDQIEQSLFILRAQFSLVSEEEIQKIHNLLRRPDKRQFLAMLFVADVPHPEEPRRILERVWS